MKKEKREVAQAGDDGGGDDWLVSYADMMTLIACFFILMMAFANYDPAGFTKKAEELSKSFNKDKYKSSDLKQSEISEEVSRHPELTKKAKVTKTDGDIAITFSSNVLFEKAQTDLTQSAESALDIIVDIVKSKTKNYRILIEGHSDPIEFQDNPRVESSWELAAIRATKVLARFEKQGFSPKRLSAISKGDSEPLVDFVNKKGELIQESLVQNRRVIIKILEPLNDKKKVKFGFGIYFDE